MSTYVLTTVAIGAASLGFYIGYHSRAGNAIDEASSAASTTHEPELPDEEDTAALIANAQKIPDGDFSSVKAGFTEPCKLVLIVRTDLKMSPGTISSLCGGATLQCYASLSKVNPKLVQHWERTGQAKIALKSTSQAHLEELEAVAKALNLCSRAVWSKDIKGQDTPSVLAIGPGPVGLVNEVTGKLRLL